MDFGELKQRQRAAWGSGDYAAFGTTMTVVSELLCEAVDLRAGWEVLDVATGSGNTALAAARRFCRVTGLDYAAPLLERARERAAVEGFEISFREGDAEDLPVPDESFDAVLSTFGVMFAPNQEKAAGELLRACRPGGRVGLASWTPGSFSAAMSEVFGRYLPPPEDLKLPPLWGTQERLLELFGSGIESLDTRRRVFNLRFRSPEHFVEVMKVCIGPIRAVFEALEPPQEERLHADLLALIGAHNRSGDATMVVPSEYLEAVAIRRRA